MGKREKVTAERGETKGHGLLCFFSVLFAGSGQGETKQANEEEEEN